MENNCNLIFDTLVSGRYSIDGLYSGVAAKWGSTVCIRARCLHSFKPFKGEAMCPGTNMQ